MDDLIQLAHRRLAIGIDLGGTKIAGALVTRKGEVLATTRRPTESASGPEAVLDSLAASIAELLAQAGGPVAGVGIGCPGLIDPAAGVVLKATNLGWQSLPLLAGLRARLGDEHPLFLQRDTVAGLLGEVAFGAGQGCRDLVYLALGTGIGSASLVNGQPVVGRNFTASEIGHLVIDPAGRPWNDGLAGPAESLLSGTGVLAEAREQLALAAYPTRLANTADLTAIDVVQAAREGDKLALAVMDKVANWLARVIAMHTIILNPERIIIGGGFGQAVFDLVLLPTWRELDRCTLKEAHEQMQIVPSRLASSALGAACLVWHQPGRP